MKNKDLNNENDIFLAKWIAGEITDIDLQKLISVEDFISYKKIKETLVLAKNLKPKSNSLKNIRKKIDQNNKEKVRKLYAKWFSTVAATVLFFIGFYHFLGSDLIVNKSNIGEQKEMALLDNSKVILNANSELRFDKKTWKNKREVFLNGEAYFKVQKGKTFIVKTRNGNISVLGTEFKVVSNSDYFEVVCYEGSVKVFHENFNRILKPNDAFRKINGNEIENWQSKVKKPTWINGESSFRSVPIKYVISKFESQYNITFNTNKIDDSIIYTGSFTHKNIDIALQSVFGASNIKYEKTNSKKVILSMN